MKKQNIIKSAGVIITAFVLTVCPMSDFGKTDSSVSSSIAITASATQDRSSNFNRSYTLTGNNATDIVNVAKKQLGKTGSNLGYTEQWCADFVTDCARLTGMSSSIVPYTYSGRGSCINLYNRMINNCGAKVVSTPKVGDFVFFDWSGKKNVRNLHHVAIVTAVSGNQVTIIGGNQNPIVNGKQLKGTTLYNRQVTVIDYTINYKFFAKFVRPNYANTSSSNNKIDIGIYYAKYTGSSCSIVTALNSLGINSSFSYRAQIAVANGIVSNTSQYKGTATQNNMLLSLLKSGKLKKVTASTSSTTTSKTYTCTIQSASGAKVRKGAGTNYGQVGGLAKGSVVTYDATKQSGGYVWYHITSVRTTAGSWGSFNGYWVAGV